MMLSLARQEVRRTVTPGGAQDLDGAPDGVQRPGRYVLEGVVGLHQAAPDQAEDA
jgi:hypothetical protein